MAKRPQGNKADISEQTEADVVSDTVEQPVVVAEAVEPHVFVRCIVENKPWASRKQMEHWGVYEVTQEEADLLETRRMAVILEIPLEKGN